MVIPGHLDPVVQVVLDVVIAIHMAVFVFAIAYWAIDLCKDPEVIFGQKQDSAKDREKFLARLEELKKKEDDFNRIGRTLTKYGKDKDGNREALVDSKKQD